MTINASDIKLLESEIMADTADGGGRRTSRVIPDGVAGNIFPKVSRLDSVYGRVNLRKVYGAVHTANTDTYAGAHAVITDAPDNERIHTTLFSTASEFDSRAAARDRIESYVTSGPESRMTLLGRQLTGQQTVTVYQRLEAPLPEVGDVFCLSTEVGATVTAQQYFRVQAIDSEIRTFTESISGAPVDFTRRVLTIGTGTPLRYDFTGPESATQFSNVAKPSKLRSTTFADAARYFGLRPLAEPASFGALSLKLDSVYTQIVPTTNRETPLANVPLATAGTLGPIKNGTRTENMGGWDNIWEVGHARRTLRGIQRGSLTLDMNGQRATDDLDGHVVIGGLVSATVDYDTGVIQRTGGTAGSWATWSATYTPAAPVTQIAHTREVRVSLANRGMVYVQTLNPLPAPGALRVDYRALGKWYRLTDAGDGTLAGDDPAYDQTTASSGHSCAAPWRIADPKPAGLGFNWPPAQRTDGGKSAPWAAFGVTAPAAHAALWHAAAREDARCGMPWSMFAALLTATSLSDWWGAMPVDHLRSMPWRGELPLSPARRDAGKLNPWGRSQRRNKEQVVVWHRYSRPLSPGWGVVTPGGPGGGTGESLIIPVQRVYIVVNEVLLLRADAGTSIPTTSLSVAFDCDSWLPTFSANIPESARDAVMPDPAPVEVVAYINDVEFRFFVEKVQRNRQFAQRTVSISGRGIACELDAPFAVASQHTNLSAMTAQQLIDASLTNTGYTQGWNITDWLVPAEAFSLYGTPAAVAGSVAEASGSVLAADWALRRLKLMPRYPVKPWDWGTATPEVVIPAAVTQTESIEWIEKPAYNVVYVSGVQQGVVGQVKITGTAGDLPAPMVTHPLITHADAARQRGISILGDTGRKAMMQISMPVLPATGVIDTCRLIEFSDGANTRRGIVRANSVSVNWPTVRQTLTIEASA